MRPRMRMPGNSANGLTRSCERIGLELEVDLRERADAAREQEFAAMEQQVLASSERLSALKAEMEELDARLAGYPGKLLAQLWTAFPRR